jgi:hypothetical protein
MTRLEADPELLAIMEADTEVAQVIFELMWLSEHQRSAAYREGIMTKTKRRTDKWAGLAEQVILQYDDCFPQEEGAEYDAALNDLAAELEGAVDDRVYEIVQKRRAQ